MNKKNLELLGLSEGATAAEIKSAYETLRAKYLEERFMDGEAGNEAAKMLTKIDTAYQELLTELNENAAADDGGASFARVEELIKSGNLQEAQHVLDSFNERTAQWHYLQSVVFYKKNWMNESKKQLEIAIRLEPENEKFKDTYKKLNDKLNYAQSPAGGASGGQEGQYGYGYQSRYGGQNMDVPPDQDQMGGGFCAQCIDSLCTCLCLNALCNSCCR